MVLAILRVGGPEQYVSQKWRGKPLHLFYITFSILKPLYSQTLLIVLVKDFCCLKFCTLSLTRLLCAVAAAKGTVAPYHSFRGRDFDDFAFFVAAKGTTGPYYSFRGKEMRYSGDGERCCGVLCFEKLLYICSRIRRRGIRVRDDNLFKATWSEPHLKAVTWRLYFFCLLTPNIVLDPLSLGFLVAYNQSVILPAEETHYRIWLLVFITMFRHPRLFYGCFFQDVSQLNHGLGGFIWQGCVASSFVLASYSIFFSPGALQSRNLPCFYPAVSP